MVLAQKVPLRPPPFLLREEGTERDKHTETEDMSDLIKTWCSSGGGGGSDGLSEGGAAE